MSGVLSSEVGMMNERAANVVKRSAGASSINCHSSTVMRLGSRGWRSLLEWGNRFRELPYFGKLPILGQLVPTIGYLATGWPADSMAARIFARLSASNSCP